MGLWQPALVLYYYYLLFYVFLGNKMPLSAIIMHLALPVILKAVRSCQMPSGVIRMRLTDQALQTVRSRQDLVRMKSRCSYQGDMNSLGYSKDAFGQLLPSGSYV